MASKSITTTTIERLAFDFFGYEAWSLALWAWHSTALRGMDTLFILCFFGLFCGFLSLLLSYFYYMCMDIWQQRVPSECTLLYTAVGGSWLVSRWKL